MADVTDDWNLANAESGEYRWMNLSMENSSANSLSYILTEREVIANSVFYAVMIPLAITGNMLSIAVSSKILTKKKSSTDLLIGFLAFSDLLNVFGIHTFSVVSLVAGHWVGGVLVCGIQYYMSWSCLKFSFFILVMLTVDRYIALVKPLRYRSMVTSYRIKLGIMIIFIFSFGSSLVTVIGYSDTIGIIKGWYICMNNWSTSSTYYIAILVIYGLTYVLGLTVFNYCNIVVAIQLCRYSNKGKSCCNSGGQSAILQNNLSVLGKRQKKERKAARIILLISLMFVIFWSPYLVTIILAQIGTLVEQDFMVTALRLLFANTFINPIVYACFNTTYRRGFLYFIKLFLYYLFCKSYTKPLDDNIFFERRSWRQEVIRVMKSKSSINGMTTNRKSIDETERSLDFLPDVITSSSAQTNEPESVHNNNDEVHSDQVTNTLPSTTRMQNSDELGIENMALDLTDDISTISVTFNVDQDTTHQCLNQESYDTCL
ncbi:histamine H2 receptor-like [Anneissia japonica]|uniref:histamine H2 receptor-like n=1 Tax=Anneissia japonica TaxID=1529436 RepID=UPI0014256E87|nr:histamine H2 receptor-like [Anneissia japonica]XP_033114691.1 histamine H2 receptor-like [Anneissia japonica]XP_033114692.1 histamine H2 receptor-like [Anneissia japonica]XP_033114693.1 histamine H2 receptor-like [Anneissia japonica]